MIHSILWLFYLLTFAGMVENEVSQLKNKSTPLEKENIPFIERLQPAPVNGGFEMDGYWVWGGCPIKGEDGKYHLFVSRWKKDIPFYIGYVFQSEVVRAVSDTPEGPYKFAEVVLKKRGPEYWDGMMTHNPTIRKLGDTYLLFYIGATYDFPKPDIPVTQHDSLNTPEQWALRNKAYNTIRIGMATSKSVYGPWERPDEPVLDVRPEKWDNTVVTNPAPFIGENNEIFLIYRSNTPKAYSRTVVWSNGDTTTQGSFERPQLLINEKGEATHLFAATADGPRGFRNATKTWCMVRPLK